MEFVIVAAAACLVFAFCGVVFMLKARKDNDNPRLHTCGQGHECQCRGKTAQKPAIDVRDVLQAQRLPAEPRTCLHDHHGDAWDRANCSGKGSVGS